MFVDDVASSASPAEPGGPDDTRASRRQYTLKGVEQEAIELMRLAADAQGMKIGHWVSDRLKEAAKRALVDADRQRDVLRRIVGDAEGQDYALQEFPRETSVDNAALLERVQRLELEVRDLTRSQRDLLNLVLAKVVAA